MFKIGLNLWSTNQNYIKEAVRLFNQEVYDYIELFVVPGSFKETAGWWNHLGIPYIVHAPHFMQGLNLAKRECFEQNNKLAYEVFKYSDELKADKIIFHPGVDGDINETIRQLKLIHDYRILIENKPYFSVDLKLACNGYLPNDIEKIMQECSVGFCFDVGHAICAANAIKEDKIYYIKKFLKLNPVLFHLTDGDWNGVIDKHLHMGQGSFEFNKFIKFYPRNSSITIECNHDLSDKLNDFVGDVAALKCFISSNPKQDCFSMRLARECDAFDIFNLSNDPAVRKNSLNSNLIPWEDHINWFYQTLKNENTKFFVLKNFKNNFIGQVRFCRIDGLVDTYSISISLVERVRGKGLSSLAIQKSSEKLFNDFKATKIVAIIKKDNLISLKSFLKSGYKLINNKIIDDVDVIVLNLEFNEKIEL